MSVLLGLLLSAAPVKVLSVDESGKDKSFAAFKRELEAAVERKDAAFVRGALDPQVQAGFGASEGVKEFLAVLPLEPSSALWSSLNTVLTRGCARTEARVFVCPGLYARAPDEIDWFEHSVLVKKVTIRSAPSADAKAVATRSSEVVKGVRGSEPWVKIETLDRVSGYVLAGELESPIDLRAFFKKGSAGWKLTFLGAGD